MDSAFFLCAGVTSAALRQGKMYFGTSSKNRQCRVGSPATLQALSVPTPASLPTAGCVTPSKDGVSRRRCRPENISRGLQDFDPILTMDDFNRQEVLR